MFHFHEAMNHETKEVYLFLMNDEQAYTNVKVATKKLQIQLENAVSSNSYIAAKRVYTKRLQEIFSETSADPYLSALTVWPLLADCLITEYDRDEL